MTVKEAFRLYGLSSADALAKRIKRAKDEGILPDTVSHSVRASFTDETAEALGLVKIPDTTEEAANAALLATAEKTDSVSARPLPIPPATLPPRPDSKTDVPAKKKKPVRTLAQKLTSDPVVTSVILVLLGADAICFGTIADNAFPDWGWVAIAIYAVIGFAVGVASIISYVRIKNEAELWKWAFAIFQLLVFLSAKFAWWNMGKVLTAVGITVSFAGVITSLRDKK